MRKVATLVIAMAMMGLAFGTSLVAAAPDYDGYSEHLLADWGTATVDGNFTTVNEYGANDYGNGGMSYHYVNASVTSVFYKDNEAYVYAMNDAEYLYLMVDYPWMNLTSRDISGYVSIDLNKSYIVEPEDFLITYDSTSAPEEVYADIDGVEVEVLNGTGFWNSPNANYNHTILEFGIPLVSIGAEPGDTLVTGLVFGDSINPYHEWPIDFFYATVFGNITLAEEPAEITEWNLFTTPTYCFAKDVNITINANIDVDVDWEEDVVCEMESHWIAPTTYRLNIEFEDELTDCELQIVTEYKEVAKKLGGTISKMVIYAWISGTKYQITPGTEGISFDDDIGDNGGYLYEIDEDTEIEMLEIIVNCDWGDQWNNMWTSNL